MNGIIETFLLAMTPIGELRAAIPVALAVYNLNWVLSYVLAVVGNLVPPLFILLFFEPISQILRKIRIMDKFFNWLFTRTEKRVGECVKKYGPLALIAFVAVPLPITGAWTGALIAYLFKLPRKKAFLSIAVGVAIAGIIVTLASKAGITIEKYLGWPALLIALALLTVAWLSFHKFLRK